MSPLRLFLLAAIACAAATLSPAQPVMEKLGRGVVAIHQPDGKVFVSWRLLATDPEAVAFNLYRKSEPLPRPPGFPPPRSTPPGATPPANGNGRRPGPGGFGPRAAESGQPVKLNAAPLNGPTCFLDEAPNLATSTSYFVRAVVDGQEQEPSTAFTFPAGPAPLPYLTIPLQTPEGYTPGDGSAGDLDGDGDYELVIKQERQPRDNSQGGATGETLLQAYKLNGRHLWTINLGRNIREGAHYTQFMVYDLDGDGRAEVVCKTADGTIDGTGKVIGDANANWVQPDGASFKVMLPPRDGNGPSVERTVSPAGHILSGPEYLTVFSGATGAALATTDYIPGRIDGPTTLDPQGLATRWGDASGNRSDRYLAAVAYLDGVHPSVVMCRGYYTRSTLVAWDWRDGKLTRRWFFDSDAYGPADRTNPYRGQGNHNLTVADVDADGRDEIVYGAMVIDDDGKPLYSTGWGHGDAMHVSDLVPDNSGLEVFTIQERFDKQGMAMRDARTGRPLFTIASIHAAESGGDAGEGPGRGVAFNIDPRYPGAESWARGAAVEQVGMLDAHGRKISDRTPRSCNFAIYWDGDFLQELLDRNTITKWHPESGTESTLLIAQGASSNNGTKATPTLCADLFGDWREELVLRSNDGKELRIYTTTIPTPHRLCTLMHDRQYRLAIAWQNVAYNQPPHPSFYLDEAAPLPPKPVIRVAEPR